MFGLNGSYCLGVGFAFRMLRYKNGTAVFKGPDGNIISTNLQSDINNLLFIHSCQWTQHRKVRSGIHGGNTLCCLTGHLPYTITGDKAVGLFFFRNYGGDAEHSPLEE